MVHVRLTPQECAVLMGLLEECMKRNEEHPLREYCDKLYENFVKQVGEELDRGTPP